MRHPKLLSTLVVASLGLAGALPAGADPTVPAPADLPFDYAYADGQLLSDDEAAAFLLAEVNRTRLSYGMEALSVSPGSVSSDCIVDAMVRTATVSIPTECRPGHSGGFLVAGQAYRVVTGSGSGPSLTFAADWLAQSSRGVMLNPDWESASVSVACVGTPAAAGDVDQRRSAGAYVAVLPFNLDGHRPTAAEVTVRPNAYESSNELRGTVACDEQGRWFWKDADTALRPVSGELTDQVRRLYLATFLREPDAGGLDHWRRAIAGGVSVAAAAQAFAASPEFEDRYGSLDNEAFVALLYRNVLERDADADGLGVWSAALDSGDLDRGEVLLGFANSVEFVGSTGTFRPGERADLFRLYEATFLREPDEEGFRFWASRGLTFAQVADAFVTSPEFVQRYGQLSDREFVELVYANVLGRGGDADGVEFWTERIQTGAATRAEMMIGFSESPEFRLRTDTL